MALSLFSAATTGFAMDVSMRTPGKNAWNPNGVDVPFAVPEYVKDTPAYLDGSLVGDAGFDPLCLAAYSWPAFQEKGMGLFGERKPGLLLSLPDFSSAQRKKCFDELTFEEQKQSVMWLREAELKHARLAMLAVVGWPLGELANSGFLHQYGDLHGRTPSLFNGGLLENFAPMWLLFLGAASYVEITSAERPERSPSKGGHSGWSPSPWRRTGSPIHTRIATSRRPTEIFLNTECSPFLR